MIAERDMHEIVMIAIAAGQAERAMPDFGYLPYFRAISREQMSRLNRAYDDARNQHASRRWRTNQ